MPKVSDAHCDARRQQILLAACICMGRKGFRQTTMREICRQAGLSPGAVYSYFEGKEAILSALAEEGLQSSREILEELRRAEQLRPAVRRLVTFLRECDRQNEAVGVPELDLNRVKVGLWAEAVQDPAIGKLFEEQSKAFMGAMTDLVRRAQRAGEVRPGFDPNAVARVLGSMWEGLTLQRAVEPGMDVDRYVEAMLALVDGALGPAPTEPDGRST